MAALDMISVGQGGYHYNYMISDLADGTVQIMRSTFENARKRGIITADAFEDDYWTWSDEKQRVGINFNISPSRFCALMDVTPEQCALAFRVVILSAYGYSAPALQTMSRNIRSAINNLALPSEDAGDAVLGFFELLPGDTSLKHAWQEQLYDLSEKRRYGTQGQRTLAEYRSYLKFDWCLRSWWATAKTNDKILYFPVYFWWRLTCTIPLRPTEITLTPRQCLRVEGDRQYLSLRRTKLKGKIKSSDYCISDDYEICEYQIPMDIAEDIKCYLDATSSTYQSDIDTLFSKCDQFSYAGVFHQSDNRYSSANLRQCLALFLRNIVEKQYHYVCVASNIVGDALDEDAIIPPRLGDTRHIAMVSLVFSGASPSVCKQLAGHHDIQISAHYFSNIRSFLDALALEPYSPSFCTDVVKNLSIATTVPVTGGYCQNVGVQAGDYSACAKAIDSSGHIGACSCCPYLFRRNGQLLQSNSNRYADELEQTCKLLRHTIDTFSEDCTGETLSCSLEQLRAKSMQYLTASRMPNQSSATYQRCASKWIPPQRSLSTAEKRMMH